jgi:hypothetical protein
LYRNSRSNDRNLKESFTGGSKIMGKKQSNPEPPDISKKPPPPPAPPTKQTLQRRLVLKMKMIDFTKLKGG